VLPDPSAADHLFPPRAPSKAREGDDADKPDRRDVAGRTRDVFSNRLSRSDFTAASEFRGVSDDRGAEETDVSETASGTSVSNDASALSAFRDADADDEAHQESEEYEGGGSMDRFPALRDAALVFWATDDSRVEDWSTCDWMCSKVLSPYARRHPASGDAARALLRWARDASAPPFARRAALVAFVGDVDGDDEASSPDARFGDGFMMELSLTCAAALGIAARVERGDIPGTLSVFAETLGEKDPGETSDPTTDPEAWVRIGARWMLSLCARAMERAAGERARDFPEARTKARTAETKSPADGSTPTKKPRSSRKRPRAAQA
jgi:hypothetical protein